MTSLPLSIAALLDAEEGDNDARGIPEGGPNATEVWSALNPALSKEIVFPLPSHKEQHKAHLRQLATKYFGKPEDARAITLTFYCHECDVTISHSSYTNHQQAHKRMKSGELEEKLCEHCPAGVAFPDEESFTIHMQATHFTVIKPTSSIKRASSSTTDLLQVVRSGVFSRYCAQCELLFHETILWRAHVTAHRKQSLRQYRMTLHDVRRYKCRRCAHERPNVFPDLKSLQMHYDRKHPRSLLNMKHSKEVESNLVKSGHLQLRCDGCTATFTSRASLNAHADTHFGDDNKPAHCETCERRFKNHKILNKHRVEEHKLVDPCPNPYKCGKCDERFDTKMKLVFHVIDGHPFIRMQSTRRVWTCPQCHKEMSKSAKKNHLNTHSNTRPFKCNMCPKTFHSSGSHDIHYRIQHTGERRHLCQYCDMAFTQANALRQHEASQHTRMFPFHCRLCERSETIDETIASETLLGVRRKLTSTTASGETPHLMIAPPTMVMPQTHSLTSTESEALKTVKPPTTMSSSVMNVQVANLPAGFVLSTQQVRPPLIVNPQSIAHLNWPQNQPSTSVPIYNSQAQLQQQRQLQQQTGVRQPQLLYQYIGVDDAGNAHQQPPTSTATATVTQQPPAGYERTQPTTNQATWNYYNTYYH